MREIEKQRMISRKGDKIEKHGLREKENELKRYKLSMRKKKVTQR